MFGHNNINIKISLPPIDNSFTQDTIRDVRLYLKKK